MAIAIALSLSRIGASITLGPRWFANVFSHPADTLELFVRSYLPAVNVESMRSRGIATRSEGWDLSTDPPWEAARLQVSSSRANTRQARLAVASASSLAT